MLQSSNKDTIVDSTGTVTGAQTDEIEQRALRWMQTPIILKKKKRSETYSEQMIATSKTSWLFTCRRTELHPYFIP